MCENAFEGGGWLQVRYIDSLPEKWYRAQDGLRGTDVYGYPGLSEYSIYFKNLMKTTDELLFVLGMQGGSLCIALSDSCPSVIGNYQHWLITNWDQVYNNGNTYTGIVRTIFKSSANPNPSHTKRRFYIYVSFDLCACSHDEVVEQQPIR